MHPAGLAPRIVNYAAWRAHLLARLHRQIDLSADPALIELLREVAAYPAPPGRQVRVPAPLHTETAIALPLQLRTEAGVLAFISTTTIFGTPVDITMAELAIESFFPADTATAEAMRNLGAQT